MSVVSAQGLSLTYPGNIEALKNVDLSIEAGEFVSFIGPSGCGKTTLLRVVADLEQPTGGTVLVTGQTPEQARQARAYGYVFQQPGLLPWRTVEGNIFLPLALMGQKRGEAAGRIA
ncbi:MAG: ATP-binding cassette domain-containing protein, partial [Alphaproteobacteria bacterium]